MYYSHINFTRYIVIKSLYGFVYKKKLEEFLLHYFYHFWICYIDILILKIVDFLQNIILLLSYVVVKFFRHILHII